MESINRSRNSRNRLSGMTFWGSMPKAPLLYGLTESKRRLLEWVYQRAELSATDRLVLEKLLANVVQRARMEQEPF